MISILETRELLGELAVGKSDEDIARIREKAYAFADCVTRVFIKRRPVTERRNEKGQPRERLARRTHDAR